MSEVPKEIKKISDFEWELPTSYKKGMIVNINSILFF